MGEVATIDTPRQSLLATMASRYSMEPKAFADTLRATVVPKTATNEEFAAFLIVAKEYDLNPITKEIFAFPKQGGGIQPIVSVDGWANLINSHPKCDGVEFEDHLNDKGDLVSITCRIYRKDRSRPTTATEYMSECKRDTPTWRQWPRRMLRHKALIQAARYAFGFAGIVDEDEAERVNAAIRDVTPPTPPKPPAPPAVSGPQRGETVKRIAAESIQRPNFDNAEQDVVEAFDVGAFVEEASAALDACQLLEELDETWACRIEPSMDDVFPPDREILTKAYKRTRERLS